MEKKLCKLTDENNQTKNYTQWGENVTHTASGEGELCSSGWIHYYDSPLLAVLLNPIHGNFSNPNLWEITVSGLIKTDKGLKFGAQSVTTIKQIELPKITTNQKVAFAILCALEVHKDEKFREWANNWLNNIDRSYDAARAAAAAAYAAAYAAVYAARAAADAAYAADAAAVYAAANDADEIDLHSLALKALEYN